MTIDPKIRRRALRQIQLRRERNEAESGRRHAEIYRRIPKVREIDISLRAMMPEVAASALRGGTDARGALNAVRIRSLDLQAERAELLVANGYPINYLDELHSCALCGDRGYVGSEPCSCLSELMAAEQRDELSSLLDLSGQSFATFNFSYYSEMVDPQRGISPRENIEINYDICLEYARKFGSSGKIKNLFLNGAPGLGKTFLSACIAGEVSAAGYSVVYDTAINILQTFEDVRFGREESGGKAAARRFLECDLLIMDDLGTEMTGGFALSALYNLINSRLISGKRTVINSNLTSEDFRRRYTPQIISRLEGEYTTLYFFGSDIRLLKKNNA